MRASGQKLVKLCARTHTHAAKLVVEIRRTNTSVSSHVTMILECVLARSIVCSKILVSDSSWVLNNSGRYFTPVCSTTFTNWPLVKPPASISHWCSLRI